MRYRWQLIKDQCTGCGICVDLCSVRAISMPREKSYPEGIDEKCTGCLVCVEECPFEAIEVIENEIIKEGEEFRSKTD